MQRKQDLLSIGQAAQYLGVSQDTLRRWANDASFPPTYVSPGGHRYYSQADLQQRTKGLTQSVFEWASAIEPHAAPDEWYCQTSDVFRARLHRLNGDMARFAIDENRVPYIVSAVGEIGNNSFDHNLGNWPDQPGTVFAYDLGKRTIVLGDRGVGVLATLHRVRPTLETHLDALIVAFTEVVTGRARNTGAMG